MANKKDDETIKKVQETRYSKQQLVLSKKYSSNRDLLQAILEDEKKYTLKEVENKVEEFKKRRV